MNAKQWANALVKEASFTEEVPVTVLTNILMLTNDPYEQGFESIGSGCFGEVWAHDKTPNVVYKVAHETHSSTNVLGGYKLGDTKVPTRFYRTAADGFAVWATLCVEYQHRHGDAPFLPKFYKVQHSRDRSVYAMELLDAFYSDESEYDERLEANAAAAAFADVLGAEPRYWCDPHEFNTDDWHRLLHFADWLKARLPAEFDSWDIHSGNVMLRDECPVLTDPWRGIPSTSRPVSLPRRLSASLGVSV